MSGDEKIVGEGEAAFRQVQADIASRIEREGPLLPQRGEIPAKPGKGPQKPNGQHGATRTAEGLYLFESTPLGEALDLPEEPIAWLVDDFLPERSLCLLSSYPKVGKSTFASAMSIAVSRGEPFMGYQTRHRPVLWISVEESERDILRRFRIMGAQASDNIRYHTHPFPNTKDALASLRQEISEICHGLVILDTWNTFSSVKDENDNAEVIRAAGPLLDMAHETGSCIYLLAHSRKSEGDGGRAVRGASSLLGLVDHSYELGRRQGGGSNDRTIKYVGRYSEITPELVITLDGDTYLATGRPMDLSHEADAEKVLSCLSTETAMSEAAIIQASGLKRMNVRRSLNRLGRDINRTQTGPKREPILYTLPE